MNLTLEEAKRIADGAFAKAKQLDIRISVAVADAGGRLIHLKRMDGGIWAANYGCQGKALAATAFQMPSAEVGKLAETIEFQGIEAQEGWHFAAGGGGVPIYRKGVLIGGCGVGGGTGGEDEECALAGVASLAGATTSAGVAGH